MDEKGLNELSVMYDASSEAYDKLYEGIQLRKYILLYNMLKGRNILDVGIGTGYLYKNFNGYVIGIDISIRSLAIAYKRGKYIDCILGDGRDPPVRPIFDTVFCISTIHHLGDITNHIDKLLRLGRRGAITILKKLIEYREVEKLAHKNGLKIIDLWDEYGLVKL